MSTISVDGELVISRPIGVVQSQFVDMERHASVGVHADLNVSNVRPKIGGCLMTGRRRVLGMLQEDEIEVMRDASGNSTLRSISGTNAGLLITQRFEAEGADKTRVHTTVEYPVRGILQLLSPLLRMGLKRDLTTALEEDRIDLEERGYGKS